MATNQIQAEIFMRQRLTLELPDANVSYQPNFMQNDAAWRLYEQILEQVTLEQDTITVYGKAHLTPRLSCWMGDAGLNYRYSNHTMTPVPWSALLLAIKQEVEQSTNAPFNSVLINYYRDGQDSNGWHADDEPELGHNPIIASLSLGAPRDFHLRHKQNKALKHGMALEHGSLLIMRGPTQRYWQHQIPKRAHADGRINLTFRKLIRPASG